MIDLNEVREAFAAYRGLGKHQIDVMIEEIQQLRAINAELVAALEPFGRKADAVSLIIALGHIGREDLWRARAAIARAEGEA